MLLDRRPRRTLRSTKENLSPLEEQRPERRQSQDQRIRPAVLRNLFGLHAAGITDSTARGLCSVAVQQLAPISAEGDTDAVRFAWYRGKVADDENRVLRTLSLSQQ